MSAEAGTSASVTLVVTNPMAEVKCPKCGVVVKHTWELEPFSIIELGKIAEAQLSHDSVTHQ